jgi:transposase
MARKFINESMAEDLKRRLASGERIPDLVKEYGVSYQSVYKLARGQTWKEVAPDIKPPVLGRRGPPRRITIKRWYLIWDKRRKGVAPEVLAEITKMGTSSVRRLVREFGMMVSVRVSQLQLSSGSYEPVKRKYGITRGEAERLDHAAASIALPARLQRILESEFPELERQLGKGKSDG